MQIWYSSLIHGGRVPRMIQSVCLPQRTKTDEEGTHAIEKGNLIQPVAVKHKTCRGPRHAGPRTDSQLGGC